MGDTDMSHFFLRVPTASLASHFHSPSTDDSGEAEYGMLGAVATRSRALECPLSEGGTGRAEVSSDV